MIFSSLTHKSFRINMVVSPIRQKLLMPFISVTGSMVSGREQGRILHPTKEVKRLWSRKYEKGWEPDI